MIYAIPIMAGVLSGLTYMSISLALEVDRLRRRVSDLERKA